MLNFLGIGAQKAGTTWIAANLAKHPQIAFPAGKEVHFWNKHYDNGVDWYESLFNDTIVEKHSDDQRPSGSANLAALERQIFNGDITPAYAFLPLDKIQQAHQLNPDLPIIYCVRNPIDRAWSAARMMLERCEMTMDEASDEWFVDLFNSQGSLLRGDYIMALDNWASIFGEDKILVLDFEDIKSAPNDLLQKCCTHIGIHDDYFSKEAGNVTHQRVHQSIGSSQIRPSLLPILHDLYDDKIQKMQNHPILGQIYGQ